MPEIDPPACWLNGLFVAATEANVSIFDHGLLYGDGVFEGIRFYARRVFRLHGHLLRLDPHAYLHGKTYNMCVSDLRCNRFRMNGYVDGFQAHMPAGQPVLNDACQRHDRSRL
ncbi:MAG: hypothetical protein P8011_08515 [Acidihalobacter sp.]|uniref:hypothetical protein n=1 Tax=Acidihalobacter sp. TaxID=1872108 RepID=UPI00307DB129